jgi:cold shock CspA family protein
MVGNIYLYNPERKFGYIASPGAERDTFFYDRDVVGERSELEAGALVEYSPLMTDRGPRAMHVVVLEP